MTLLTIARAAADEIGIQRPSSVYSNTAPEVQKLLRYANKVGRRFMKSVVWQVLRKEQTFTAIAGETQTGILPSNFDRFIPETFWDRSGTKLISGPISSVEWQGLKATSYSGPTKKFIYRGGDVLILPAQAGGESLAFEYVSKNWCQSSGGTAQSEWLADTDTGILDEELLTLGLIFAYLTGEGLPNQAAGAELNEYANTILGNDQPSAGIMVSGDIFGGGRHFSGTPPVDLAGTLTV